MREINFKQKDINNLTTYNKGGFEGVIRVYSIDLVMKVLEDYLDNIMDINLKKMKLINLREKDLPEHIIIKPHSLVNIDGKFKGYIMPKIEDSIRIDSINDYRKLIKVYRLLFQNLEYLHENEIIINDVKPENIILDKNKTPIFIDIDSMGVDEYPPDHLGMKPRLVQKIANIDYKIKANDPKSIDKLKLLSCFIETLNQGSNLFNRRTSDQNYNLDFATILHNSALSEGFKEYLNHIITTDDNLCDALSNIDERFLEEEMQERKRRR